MEIARRFVGDSCEIRRDYAQATSLHTREKPDPVKSVSTVVCLRFGFGSTSQFLVTPPTSVYWLLRKIELLAQGAQQIHHRSLQLYRTAAASRASGAALPVNSIAPANMACS